MACSIPCPKPRGASQQEREEAMPFCMRAAMAAWISCTGLLLAGVEVSAQSLPPEIAARVELSAIPSLTLSDRQFLNGDAADAKPVTVAGEFRLAQGSGRLPV